MTEKVIWNLKCKRVYTFVVPVRFLCEQLNKLETDLLQYS